MENPLIQCEWENLVFINYEVDSKVLESYLPTGVEIDHFAGKCYASLIGLLFKSTHIKGIRYPFHNQFEEINFRFYVKRKVDNVMRKGVVFIKEFVSKPLVALGAKLIFGENYIIRPTKYYFKENDTFNEIEYHVKEREWNYFSVKSDVPSSIVPEVGFEDFIINRPWGYVKRSKGTTIEYYVEHPKWMMNKITKYHLQYNFGNLYSPSFAILNNQVPFSLYYIKGSSVEIKIEEILKD